MTRAELFEAVESYGVKPITENADTRRYSDILGVRHPGSGSRRAYSGRHVRRMVAWRLVMAAAGVGESGDGRPTELRRRAIRVLAGAPHGWVIVADGAVGWSAVPPVATLRSRCALAIPVPEWRH